MRRTLTSYLLTCAAIGVAGGFLTVPANWLSTLLFVIAPFASVGLAGLWLLPAVIGMRLLERPGTALLIGLTSGLIASPLSGYGFASVATNLWWAFFIELPFLVVLYRWFTIPQYFLGAIAVGLVWSPLVATTYGFETMAPGVVVGFFVLVIAGGSVGVAVGLLIASGLKRAGVGRAARRRPRVPGEPAASATLEA